MADSLHTSNLFDVAGYWVAITGGASGIGRMLARGFTANGANTILIDINEKLLLETKTELEATKSSSPTTIITIQGDLSTEEGVSSVVEKVKAALKSQSDDPVLDVLIHCAAVRHVNEMAYTPGESLQQLQDATLSCSYAGWEHTFRVNVLAPYYLTAGLITLLGAASARGGPDGRGNVILFSSPASVHNNQFVPTYQTSKAAVDHLVRILAAEFADYYIRVNAMSPGIVPSGMTLSAAEGGNLDLAVDAPAKRAGGAGDMVGTAIWLASKAGAFMDGKVVRVEGGRLLILKGVTANSD